MLKKLIKTDSVSFFDFEHGDENLGKFLPKVILDHGNFLEEWVKVDIEVIKIVDFVKFLLKDHFDNQETQSKNVCFFEVNFGVLTFL